MGTNTKQNHSLIKNKYLISVLAAISSAFLYAWSIKIFVNPSGLLSGGVMGISLIISRILENFFNFYIGPGTLLALINTPLAILLISQ